jgi:spore coat polysaccharide biosynthesis predicted glycosyltransferase SpsG
MSEIMAWTDVAVSGGGSTCWELAYMGVPNVALVLAENQKNTVAGLAEIGVLIGLGSSSNAMSEIIACALNDLMFDLNKRLRMRESGRRLIDGKGIERLLVALRES